MVKGDVLKLIKTLNSGLDQDALSDGHIEEAFEVWWPKLDSQLKTLPAEGRAIMQSKLRQQQFGSLAIQRGVRPSAELKHAFHCWCGRRRRSFRDPVR